MKFGDIVGSDELKKILIHNIKSGRVAHAQIFEGRAGYQSLSFALAYAQYLNCTSPINGDSCGECNACLKNELLQHPDVYFIYPVGVPLGKKGKKEDYTSTDFVEVWRNTILKSTPKGCFSENEWYRISGIGGEKGNSQGSIGRSEADYIMDQMLYSPIDGGFRIFIIWLPERMNNAAANALLKLFEEPSAKTIFLFISEQPQQVLQTITSRTQNIIVPAVNTDDICEFLMRTYDKEPSVAFNIASAANGDICEAVKLISNEERENSELEMFINLTRYCYGAKIESILAWVDDFAVLNKEQQKKFFRESTDVLRASFMMNVGAEKISYCWGAERDFVLNFHKIITPKNIEPIINEFERAFKELSQNGNTRIVTTHFALTLISKLRLK